MGDATNFQEIMEIIREQGREKADAKGEHRLNLYVKEEAERRHQEVIPQFTPSDRYISTPISRGNLQRLTEMGIEVTEREPQEPPRNFWRWQLRWFGEAPRTGRKPI